MLRRSQTLDANDFLTLSGIGVAIAIGIRNWAVTEGIRAGTIQLEEFRSQIRDPIQAGLTKLSAVREALVALQRPNAVAQADLVNRISDQIAVFEYCAQDLGDLFDHADKSSFTNGTDWKQRYSKPLDDTAALLGRCATGTYSDIQVGAALASAASEIVALTSALRSRFEHEVRQTIPAGLMKRRHAFPPALY